MSKNRYICDWCKESFQRYPSQVKGKSHLFCSRECLAAYSNKQKNPKGYSLLKDFTNISGHMTKLNREMNPIRMTQQTRATMRKVRLDTGKGISYSKYYGRLEHRVVAEKKLGRQLMPNEVVHHLDFNIRNANPENLMIFASNADHTKYHAVLRRFFENGTLPEVDIKEVVE